MAKVGQNIIGAWAFLIGIILAIIVGLLGLLEGPSVETWTIVLVLLGVIIGLLNVIGTEVKEFLMAGAVLVIVSALGGQAMLSVNYIGPMLQALIVLFVPVTIIVALKAVFSIARK